MLKTLPEKCLRTSDATSAESFVLESNIVSRSPAISMSRPSFSRKTRIASSVLDSPSSE